MSSKARRLIIGATLLVLVPAGAAAIELSGNSREPALTNDAESNLSQSQTTQPGAETAPSSSSPQTSNTATVSVNGQTFALSGNGSLDKTISDDSGTTHVKMFVHSNNSAAQSQSQSHSSLNVESSSSSSSEVGL